MAQGTDASFTAASMANQNEKMWLGRARFSFLLSFVLMSSSPSAACACCHRWKYSFVSRCTPTACGRVGEQRATEDGKIAVPTPERRPAPRTTETPRLPNGYLAP